MKPQYNIDHHWQTLSPTESRVDLNFSLDFKLRKNATTDSIRRAIFNRLSNKILPQVAKDAPTVAQMHEPESASTDYDFVNVDSDVSIASDEKWRQEGGKERGIFQGKISVDLKADQPISPAEAFRLARAGIADNLASHITTSYDQHINGQQKTVAKTKASAKERGGKVQSYQVQQAA